MAASKALELRQVEKEVRAIADKIELMRYNGRWRSDNNIGRPLATAIGSLTNAAQQVNTAAAQLALEEVDNKLGGPAK